MLDNASILRTRANEILRQKREALLQKELSIVEPYVNKAVENGKMSISIRRIQLSKVTCEYLEKNGFYVENILDMGEEKVIISWDVTEE